MNLVGFASMRRRQKSCAAITTEGVEPKDPWLRLASPGASTHSAFAAAPYAGTLAPAASAAATPSHLTLPLLSPPSGGERRGIMWGWRPQYPSPLSPFRERGGARRRTAAVGG